MDAWDGDVSLRAELPWIAVGIAALAFGYALGLQASPAGRSIFGMIQPGSFASQASLVPQMPGPRGVRVASLDTDVVPESAFADTDGPSGSSTVAKRYVSFDQRLLFDPGAFDQPAGPSAFRGAPRGPTGDERARAHRVPGALGSGGACNDPSCARRVGAAPAPSRLRRSRTCSLMPDTDTAIYDIAAHTVYLPNGQKLEAHSGLCSLLDDPRHVDAGRDHGADAAECL